MYKKCYSESHYKEETVYTFLKVYFLKDILIFQCN